MIIKNVLNFRYVISRKLHQNIISPNMGDKAGLPVQHIINKLTEFAPLSLAESWDNVGVLVDPGYNGLIENVFLTNDLTEEVVKESIKCNAKLIVSYHPNIFQGLKSVSQRTWKERIVVMCIQNNITVFSPHTSWDSVQGGVNDWLAGAFDFTESKPILPKADNPNQGAGRLLVLKETRSLWNAVVAVKTLVDLKHVRVAAAKNISIEGGEKVLKTVALCAGSGASVLKGVSADIYITGEMLHHDVLDATQNGIHVILTNHSDSERGFLTDFQETLQQKILENKANVLVSKVDKDPLVTV